MKTLTHSAHEKLSLTPTCRLDGSFVPWSADLRRHLLDIFPLNEGISVIPDDVLLEPKWTLALAENPSDGTSSAITNAEYHDQNIDRYDVVTPSTSRQSPKDQAHQKDIRFTVKLEKNNRLTPETHWQDVRHIQLESKAALVYDPGDVLTIYPKNRPEDVDSFLDKMDWKSIADQTLKFVQNKLTSTRDIHPEPPISILPECKGITLRGLLTDYLDLTAIPRRSFFSLIAHFTQDQSHKERLLEFTKPEYVDELYDYTTRPRRSISEVLQEFASVRIPWQWAANVLPDLRGRQFSIASGGQLKTTGLGNSSFDLLVAIVKYKTVIKRVREGVCTRYLAALCPGSEMTVTLQKGGLGITRANARRPVIMIGPGTGLAPMRSLIWERLLWVEEHEAQTQWCRNGNGTPNGFHGIGESVLFFGSRNKGSDYFYQHEWEDLKGKMPLQVYTAFSRDQKEKVYVQDLIKEQASLVYRLLHDSGGIVYVCGSSGKMPQAVRVALTEVFKLCGGMPQGTAEEYLQIMEKEGRYKQETW